MLIRSLEPSHQPAFEEMLEDFRRAGEAHVFVGIFAVALDGFQPYYVLLDRMRNGNYPEAHNVPMEPYGLFVGEDMVGELFIRRRLSAHLRQRGGHIGYKIRPSFRNRGFASAALKFGIAYLRDIGVARALVTCKIDNAASARVIEKAGGIRLRDTREDRGIPMKRFFMRINP